MYFVPCLVCIHAPLRREGINWCLKVCIMFYDRHFKFNCSCFVDLNEVLGHCFLGLLCLVWIRQVVIQSLKCMTGVKQPVKLVTKYYNSLEEAVYSWLKGIVTCNRFYKLILDLPRFFKCYIIKMVAYPGNYLLKLSTAWGLTKFEVLYFSISFVKL